MGHGRPLRVRLANHGNRRTPRQTRSQSCLLNVVDLDFPPIISLIALWFQIITPWVFLTSGVDVILLATLLQNTAR